MVLIHGLGSAGYMEWRFNLPSLAGAHRVYAPDLPGFGRSDKPRTRYGIPYFAATLAEYMRGRGLRSAAVVGASLGGRVALELALDHSELVDRLVLVNSFGLGRPALKPLYLLVGVPRLGEALVKTLGSGLRRARAEELRLVAAHYMGAGVDVERVIDEGYLEDMRQLYAAEGYGDAYVGTVRSLLTPAGLLGGPQLLARVARKRLPVQLIWGSADTLFPLQHARDAHRVLPGSLLVVIEGAGHTPQAERPDQFNHALEAFLRA